MTRRCKTRHSVLCAAVLVLLSLACESKWTKCDELVGVVEGLRTENHFPGSMWSMTAFHMQVDGKWYRLDFGDYARLTVGDTIAFGVARPGQWNPGKAFIRRPR